MATRIATEPTLELEIDGTAIVAHRVRGRIATSELFRLEADAHEEGFDGGDPEARLGKPARLVIQPVVGPPLIVQGVVTAISTSATNERDIGILLHTFEIGPAAAVLTVGREHRYFQEMDVVEIVNAVLDGAAVPDLTTSFDIVGSYRKRDYTTQWGESDWVFIERLLREEGISYRFDFEDPNKLVFFDDSTVAPDVEGGAMPHMLASALDAEKEAVVDLTEHWVAVPDSVVLRDYDPKKPALDLEVKAEAGAKWPRYDFPGRYLVQANGKQLAQRRLDALRAKRSRVRGRTTNPRLWPGRAVDIEDGPFPIHNRVLIGSLDIDVRTARFEQSPGAEFRFEAVPAATSFRPPRCEETAAISTVQTGFVVGPPGKELHTDDAGLVRAQFPWDRVGQLDDKSSVFMRVGQFALGQSMVRPRIGWEVLIEHQAGDADLPLLVSHLYDGTNPPPYPLPANKTRTAWQTATTPGGGSSNEIRFEDKSGSEEIFLNASKDMIVAVGDTKTKKVGSNHDHDIGSNSTITVGSGRSIGVKANQTFKVGASESLTVSGKRETGVTGSDTITIGADRNLTTTMGRSIQAKGSRTLTVGGNMMDISAIGVSRAVLGSASITVSGAWISATAMGLANATAGATAETVGGVKLQLGAKGCSLTVKGALAETVGAAYVTAAGGNVGETATGNVTFLVGGAFIVNSPSIEITADSEISIMVGATSLKITSGKVEVKSPAIPQPAAAIAKDGSKIQHNA